MLSSKWANLGKCMHSAHAQSPSLGDLDTNDSSELKSKFLMGIKSHLVLQSCNFIK